MTDKTEPPRIQLPQIVRGPDQRLLFRAVIQGKETTLDISQESVMLLTKSLVKLALRS